jgi:hypothetical protein
VGTKITMDTPMNNQRPCKGANIRNIVTLLTASFILLSSSFALSSCKQCGKDRNGPNVGSDVTTPVNTVDTASSPVVSPVLGSDVNPVGTVSYPVVSPVLGSDVTTPVNTVDTASSPVVSPVQDGRAMVNQNPKPISIVTPITSPPPRSPRRNVATTEEQEEVPAQLMNDAENNAYVQQLRIQTDADKKYIEHLDALSNDNNSYINTNIRALSDRSRLCHDKDMDALGKKYKQSCDIWIRIKDNNIVGAISDLRLAVEARGIAVDKYLLWEVKAAEEFAAKAKSHSNHAKNKINSAKRLVEKAKEFMREANDLRADKKNNNIEFNNYIQHAVDLERP